MIQKVSNLGGFKDVLDYVLDKEEGRFLDSNMIICDIDSGQYAKEMMRSVERKNGTKEIKNKGKHIILSWHPDEKLSKVMKIDIGREYLERMGYKNCNYVMAEHFDKEHQHLHIVVSSIDNETKNKVKDNNEKYRGRTICIDIEDKYDLVKTNMFARNKLDKRLEERYQKNINEYVKNDLHDYVMNYGKSDPVEFVKYMKEKGVSVQIVKNKNNKGKKEYSLSFSVGEYSFSQRKLGVEINTALKWIKNEIPGNENNLVILNSEKIRELMGKNRRKFYDSESKKIIYDDANTKYKFVQLEKDKLFEYKKGDVEYMNMTKEEKQNHINELRYFKLNEFRLNPVQLKEILKTKNNVDREYKIKEALEFNKYRVGESIEYHINNVINVNVKTTKSTLNIPDEVISKKNQKEVELEMLKKVNNASSESERALYLLATRMVSKGLIKDEIHKGEGFVVKRFDVLVDDKVKEILTQREEWKNRIMNYRSRERERKNNHKAKGPLGYTIEEIALSIEQIMGSIESTKLSVESERDN